MRFAPRPRRRPRPFHPILRWGLPTRADSPRLEALEERLAPSVFIVSSAADSGTGTLRQAILDANASQGADQVQFTLAPGTTIALNSSIGIADDLTIAGPGANQLTIDGQNATQLFNVGGVAALTISDLTLTRGLANGFNGGAVQLSGNPGAVTFQNVTFSNNSSTGNGGALDTPGTTQLVFQDCTFSGNSSGSQGGAVSVGTGTVTLSDCTFSGNSAVVGGAINSNFAANFTLTDSTLADNTANAGGAISVTGGSLSLGNTIVAGNTATTGPDIAGPVISNGYNLIQDLTGTTLSGDSTGNVIGKAAALLPLGFYGGPTETQPPLPTSPAVNAGRPTNPVTGDFDQRGESRLGFGFTDIGAVHLHTVTVTNSADNGEGTLRDAINQANASVGPARIRFQFPSTGVTTIQPLPIGGGVALPVISNRVFLDGWSQGGIGYAGPPLVEIDGSLAPGTFGLNLQAPDSVIRGFAINRFAQQSGNGFGIGVFNGAANDWISGNYIGTTADGQSAAGNGQGGIWVGVGPTAIRIGTDGDGFNDTAEGNLIADNPVGVLVAAGATGVTISQNSITATGGPAIDRGGDGPTPAGRPVLLTAASNGEGDTVTGYASGTPGASVRVEVFATPIADGPYQGARFLGETTVAIDGTGRGAFTLVVGVPVAGEALTASATDLQSGDTSEFSPGPPVQLATAANSTSAQVNTFFNGPLQFTALDAFGAPVGGVPLTFAVPGTGASAALPFTQAETNAASGAVALNNVQANQVAGSYQLQADGPGGLSAAFSLVNVPGPAAFLSLDNLPAALTAGDTASATVTAFDRFGNVATGYVGTIHFISSDPQATLPADYTFTPNDQGSHAFPDGVALRMAGPVLVTVSDAVNVHVIGSQADVIVSPGPANSLTVGGFPNPVTAGTAGSLAVTVRDQFGNVVSGYTGTVHFTSNDPQAVLPADYTFTSNDVGRHTFPGIILKSAGVRSLAVSDTVNATIAGTQSDITVNPTAASTMTVSPLPLTVTAGQDLPITVTLFDAFGNVATGDRGTVTFGSSDARASLPAAYTFTATDQGTHTFTVRFHTATASGQSVSLTITHGALTATETTQVKPAAASVFDFGGLGTSVPPGRPQDFTLTALDPFGNVVIDYGGTVTITSSDPRAILPGPVAFTSADGGQKSLEVTFRTSGPQSLFASDGTASGTLTGIEVLPAPRLLLEAPAAVDLGAPFRLTLAAVDDTGNLIPDFLGTVSFGGSPLSGLPATYTFTTADLGRHDFDLIALAPGATDVTVADTNQIAQSGSATFQINDVLPQIAVSPFRPFVSIGSPFALSGTFLYPVPSLLSATVTVGDEAAEPLPIGPGGSFLFQRVFAAEGTEPIVVRVSNASGASTTFGAEVFVLLPGITEFEEVVVLAGTSGTVSVTGATATLQHNGNGPPAVLMLAAVPSSVAQALSPEQAAVAQAQVIAFDVRVLNAGPDDLLTLTFSYPTSADPNATPAMFYFDSQAGAFVPIHAESVTIDRVHHTVTMVLGADSVPSILNLDKTVFLVSVSGQSPPPLTPFVQFADARSNVAAPANTDSDGPATRGFSSGSSDTFVLVGQQAGQPGGDSGSAEGPPGWLDSARRVLGDVVESVREGWDEIADLLAFLRTLAAQRSEQKPNQKAPAPPANPTTVPPPPAAPAPKDAGNVTAPAPVPALPMTVTLAPPDKQSPVEMAYLLSFLAGGAALAHDRLRSRQPLPQDRRPDPALSSDAADAVL